MTTLLRTLALGGALALLLAGADPAATAARTATGGREPMTTVARYPAAPAGRCAADNVPPERFCGP